MANHTKADGEGMRTAENQGGASKDREEMPFKMAASLGILGKVTGYGMIKGLRLMAI